MMNNGLKASGPPRQRSQYIVAKSLSEDPAAAKNGGTPETANRHPQDNTSASDGQIGGLPRISALDSTGTGPTARTRCRNRRAAHVKKYAIRVDRRMLDDEAHRRQSRRPKSPFHRADSLSKIARPHPSHAATLSQSQFCTPIHMPDGFIVDRVKWSSPIMIAQGATATSNWKNQVTGATTTPA
jgi:hypothetical protein